MFDGRALLIVIGALALAGVGLARWRTARGRLDGDLRWARARVPAPQPPQPQLIEVTCGDCGTFLCDVLTPRDAAVEDELHHLVKHGGQL